MMRRFVCFSILFCLSLLANLVLVTGAHAEEPLCYEPENSEGIGNGKHIVFIANDHEYRSEQTCPMLAKILAKHHGFRCTVLFGIDGNGAIKAGAKEVPGMEALGNTWHNERGQSHYGNNHQMGCTITPQADAAAHPVLTGVEKIHAYSGGYKSQPPTGATPLLDLQVLNSFEPSDDRNADKPIVCAGWTRDSYVAPSGEKKEARVVYTSYGASEDMLSEDGRRFMVNACLWAGGMEDKITADLNVAIVGGYKPSPYTTGAFYYNDVKPADLAGFESSVMPEDARLGGFENPKMARKVVGALKNRHELKAQLMEAYPKVADIHAKAQGSKKKEKVKQ